MKTCFTGAQKASILGVWKAPGAVQTAKTDDFWVPGDYVFMIILIRSWGYGRAPREGNQSFPGSLADL